MSVFRAPLPRDGSPPAKGFTGRVDPPAAATSDDSVATGMRIVTELLAAILGSLLIGWFLDRMLGTSPWFLLVLLFLGMGAAFRNVWKIASVREDSGQDKDEG